MAMEKLDGDEKAKFNLGLQGSPVNIVNESGLYSLILTSRKPEAKRFKKWVTSEVLPAIRKTGKYEASPCFLIPQTLPEALLWYFSCIAFVEKSTGIFRMLFAVEEDYLPAGFDFHNNPFAALVRPHAVPFHVE